MTPSKPEQSLNWENLIDKEDFLEFCGNEDHECQCCVNTEKIKAFIRKLLEEREESR